MSAQFDVHNHSTHEREDETTVYILLLKACTFHSQKEDETTVYILFLKGCTFQWSNTDGTFQAKAAGNT